MFSSAANPYDEIVTKATDENLASEDWDINLQICDKVSDDGSTGAKNAVAALQKRLVHRNPNVQLYALELANTLAQNCGKPLLEALSSRAWTGALDRLINDRATVQPVKKKALAYVKAWAKQFEDTGDPNLGIMGEYYDQLRAKNIAFSDPEPAPEDEAAKRRRQEEEELARVLELSKQDKGGRYQPSQSSNGGGASSSSSNAQPFAGSSSRPQLQPHYAPAATPTTAPIITPATQPQTQLVPEPQLPQIPLDKNTATRVKALYQFVGTEVGELSFERGDIIKVLDRGFQEWWRGACNGMIGIFPVTYVEAMPEPTPRELQEEAQEEARIFASLGLVDQLLQTLKSIDPSRGDRIDDRPELEEMYQASVSLQSQINALIKKYSDQKAELDHMNANFIRAIRQYEELRNSAPVQPYYPQQPQPQVLPRPDPYQYQSNQYPTQQFPQPNPSAYQPQPQQLQNQHHAHVNPEARVQIPSVPMDQSQSQSQPLPQPSNSWPPHPQAQPQQTLPHEAHQPGQYYLQQQPQHQGNQSTTSLHRAPTGAPSYPPHSPPLRHSTEPGAAGIGAGSDPANEHAAAWDAYYRQNPEAAAQAMQQAQQQRQGQQGYVASQYAPQGQSPVDGVVNGMNQMTMHGQ